LFAFGVVIVKVACSFFVRVSSFALGFELFFKASVFCVLDVLLTCLFFLSFFLSRERVARKLKEARRKE